MLMLLLLLVIASPAFGRIRETVKQIEDRYGPTSFSVPGEYGQDQRERSCKAGRILNFVSAAIPRPAGKTPALPGQSIRVIRGSILPI